MVFDIWEWGLISPVSEDVGVCGEGKEDTRCQISGPALICSCLAECLRGFGGLSSRMNVGASDVKAPSLSMCHHLLVECSSLPWELGAQRAGMGLPDPRTHSLGLAMS